MRMASRLMLPSKNSAQEKSGKVLRFVAMSFDVHSGGFRRNPERSSPATLSQTRYAMDIIRHILRDSNSSPVWLDLRALLRFTNDCFDGFGFAEVPGGSASLCGLRSASG